MRFQNPNIYCGEWWIRWTLVAFIVINTCLLIWYLCQPKKKNFKSSKINYRTIFLPLLGYLSTIPIYYFRDAIGNNGQSIIYKTAEFLNSIESLVVITILIAFAYGIRYKNAQTFIAFLVRLLASIEITYIIAYFITMTTSTDLSASMTTNIPRATPTILRGFAYKRVSPLTTQPPQRNS